MHPSVSLAAYELQSFQAAPPWLQRRCEGFTGFQKFVFVIRHPFDSIWADFARRVAKGHAAPLLKADFDLDLFERFVMQMAGR